MVPFLKRMRSSYQGLFMLTDYLEFKKQSQGTNRGFSLSYNDLWVCLGDKTSETDFERHYVYHLAWAARCVQKIAPNRHVDIGSRLFFPTILSAFVPTDFFDYRPADLKISNLTSNKGDLTNLPFKDNQLDSVSCLHTLEHIGLGRYGDPIDVNGDMKAIKELSRVVTPGGSLLIAVPMGEKMRIQFNAHRIYSYEGLLAYFPDFILKNFAYIPEESKREAIIENANPSDIKDDVMGCGCLWLVKKTNNS
jgi:SAM-dependent methyltransferase